MGCPYVGASPTLTTMSSSPDPARRPGLSRRAVLRALGLGAAAGPLALTASEAQQVPVRPPMPLAPWPNLTAPPQLIRPPRLRAGGTIGLVAPAGKLTSRRQLEDTQEELDAVGFRTKSGRFIFEQHGYLAGTDAQRADDLMAMFTDPDVDGILAMRGGWGCARILPLLDYDVIRANPKPLIGYSDITALLLAIYARSGLVTFHGPVGRSTWTRRTIDSFRQVLMHGERLHLDPRNDDDEEERSQGQQAYRPIRSGIAEGPLIGGNLSVVSAMAGTPFLPNFRDHVIFLEETNESLYRIDRMLTQLRLAGFFDEMAALIFGQCRRCTSDEFGRDGLAWLLGDHLTTIPRPAWTGAPIGHVTPVYTLPIGVLVLTDAALGTITMLEPAVS